MHPSGFRTLENGYLWPTDGSESVDAAFSQLSNLEKYYGFCRKFDVAVQAGGNCGVWPKHMATRFKTVYTFEPSWRNFHCLAANATEPNIVKFQAALGDDGMPVSLREPDDNCGANYVSGSGTFPVLSVDGLRLGGLDFLMLDIEGYEILALFGARHTIERYKPLVVVEEKGHSARYGYPFGSIGHFMTSLGYKKAARIDRDLVFTCW